MKVGYVVAQALSAVAAGTCAGLGENLRYTVLVEFSIADHRERVDGDTLLPQFRRVRRHGSAFRAADVGVVSAGSEEEQDVLSGFIKDGRHHGQVGKMCSTAH